MFIFLGVNMVMGEDGLRLGIIAEVISINKYEQILSYLHFVDNYTFQPENTDRLFKIAPVLSILQKAVLVAANLEEFQSIDEEIIPFKGQLSEMYKDSAIRGPSSDLGMATDVVMRLCDDIKNKNH
ncbi:hypothetical protein CCH79_00021125 [Gambusia affinis]|uniref:PiggyBac transposable element-derived protein domain-containing protein n=1 Tax=Gambusia affinis TaxID=33528 RepID=A0A315UQW2_GAMAF|nr:hypothetical protein CCH79_00021125 [Gambusia affinis]